MSDARAGQYTVVEQTILFAAGVAIAIGFMAAFQTLGDDVQQQTAEVQTELISRLVAADIVELVESGSHGRFTVSVPGTVAQQEYAVIMREGGVEVVTTGASHTAPVYGLLERYGASGAVESKRGALNVAFAGDQIRVTRPE